MDASFVSKLRIVIIAFFIFFTYAVILIRLWAVQVHQGEKLRREVSEQYVRQIRIPAVRGRIFTADGVMLAGNTASYEIVFHISEMRRPGKRRCCNTARSPRRQGFRSPRGSCSSSAIWRS